MTIVKTSRRFVVSPSGHQTDELQELYVCQGGGGVRVEEQLLPEGVPPAVHHGPGHHPPHALLPGTRLYTGTVRKQIMGLVEK